MKIVKPLRLSVLNRPFRWEGKNYLGVSVIALADMGPSPKLRPEVELWQLAASELQTSGGVIDMAIPKVRAEFLATGHAYTHHQQEKTACAVRIDVENLSKSLAVFGDRYWAGSKMTLPRPFDEMRLDWSRAYGGEGYEENPHGVGFRPEIHQGHEFRRLPNIEPFEGRMISPKQKPEPASFGPLDILWPRRFSRMGKKYDASWLQNDFPGFAKDIDWKVFNAASPDQWWQDRDTLPPQAKWRIWNMHPEKPLQEGTLPPWQARCFINRQRGDDTLFEEVALRATTVWFFPHLEQMMLIWQGHIRINEDDAADVLQLLPAMEKVGAPRSVNHYRKVLAQRMDKEKGALFAFREKDLVPEDAIGPWIDSEVEESASPMRDNMNNRANQLREQHRARIEASGGDVNDLLGDIEEPEMPKLDELPEFIEKMEKQAAEMQAKAEARKREMEARFPQGNNEDNQPRGPEAMHRMQEMLYRNRDSLGEKKLAQSRDALHQMYLMSVQHQPPARRLKGDLAQIIRQRAERTLAQGGDFSGMDLTGVDFSGMDLRGADFSKALLECADLSHCQLDGVNFRGAMLARAELHHTSLRDCNFEGASLSLAQCCHSDFSGARFKDTQLQETLLDDCTFDDATLEGLLFRETWFTHCRFHRATLDGCVFLELTLPGLDFRHARLNKTTFVKSTLEAADFSDATLDSCSFVETHADEARFINATWITCAAASESTLNRADFTHATLRQSNLRQTTLCGARFELAKLENTDLSEADCRGASFQRACLVGSLFIRTDFREVNFTDANLMGALLQKSQLGGADFNGANLFRADLSQSFTNDETRMNGAFTKRVKTLPKRDGEVV
ncbi:DUF2169 domain-containing protein [Cronobacter turicensis]|uniref:DUF2169 family type VI secretion system accessory protein n=1 Tax=Cronobacter turicensis TaxID=413502 RepID=UPI001DC8ABFF|nr:DUF2169 domain-containing protein [Cronobacter turicensis]EGT4493925.1 hypothetical protein [Cronobacter turicensis]EKM0438890.1 DUF2169 domain-containing protein [Cronobacter turicensis]ELY4324018.1 DUF2169 domain-containing protein [Cronobacter turicensis]ELY5944021.1 DUF2169 domain-containing protein [Cronobacter turicensis]ELY5965386.1 DUF2169 domain-containing protein [Cronobacter turicensis]